MTSSREYRLTTSPMIPTRNRITGNLDNLGVTLDFQGIPKSENISPTRSSSSCNSGNATEISERGTPASLRRQISPAIAWSSAEGEGKVSSRIDSPMSIGSGEENIPVSNDGVEGGS